MLDLIDITPLKKQPKWVVGFSDITALHSHLMQLGSVASLHATMPIVFHSNTSAAILSLQHALFGNPLQYHFVSHPLNREGIGEGIVVGGNLSVWYSLMGSRSMVNTAGKILLLEDLDEYLYHTDRMMLNLKRAGHLANLAGLIIGGFTDMNDNNIPFGKTAYEIIAEHTADYDYPIAFQFPAGHWADNRAVFMGRKARLTVNGDGVEFGYS